MTPPSAPSGEPRKTLVDDFLEFSEWYGGWHALDVFLARLNEAEADGVRIRELVADRDREAVNREAVQHVLADIVAERDALAERCKRLEKGVQEALKWLSECGPQIVEHDHGVPYDHVGIACEWLAALLEEKP